MVSKGVKKGTVLFALAPANGAKEIRVAGDFTSWKPVAMRKQKSGRFSVAVALPPGTYEYRFIVDGQWTSDPDHSHWAPNPYGSFNSVAQIS